MIYLKFQLGMLVVLAIIALVGIILRVDKYKPKKHGSGFQKTGEKFIDKGKVVEVYYNPKTGERSYKQAKK